LHAGLLQLDTEEITAFSESSVYLAVQHVTTLPPGATVWHTCTAVLMAILQAYLD